MTYFSVCFYHCATTVMKPLSRRDHETLIEVVSNLFFFFYNLAYLGYFALTREIGLI